MTTLAQIETNRRNSQKSTGPKTRAGKAASKMNSVKHGLLAQEVAVHGEDPVEFAGVLESLVDEFQPQGPLEEQLVERVAACSWRLRRVYRIEAGILTHEALTIEHDRARDEVGKFEVTDSEIRLPSFNKTHITNEKQHSRATTRLEKTAHLLQEDTLALGAAFKHDALYGGAISKLSRYEAGIERSLYKALHEVQRVQAARQNGVPPPSIAVDVTVDGPIPPSDNDD